jgi:hypothetical protein
MHRWAWWSRRSTVAAARVLGISSSKPAGWMLRASHMGEGELQCLELGHPLVDSYLAFVGARARRNTWLATAYDLKVFFTVVPKDPSEATTADVFAFIQEQRQSRRDPQLIRLEDREVGLSLRTIKRRLSTVSGLFAYLIVRADISTTRNPCLVVWPRAALIPGGGRDGVGGCAGAGWSPVHRIHADPDGHLWEILFNPGFDFGES